MIFSRKGNIMYKIEFYEDKNGKSDVADFIRDLRFFMHIIRITNLSYSTISSKRHRKHQSVK